MKKRPKQKKPHSNAEQRRVHSLKKFGLTVEKYNVLLDSQGGGCGICGKEAHEQGGKRLAVDHDHTNGKVRGLLCSNCNQGIGLLGDTFESVRNAVTYLLGGYVW